jgi:hypothetical protein
LSGRLKKLAWFTALYAASLAVLALVAYGLRAVLLG